ncbi:hypothetical protein F610DRAFT_06963 [Streptomyces sp. LaPpAH-199]|nr:hypothetical protein F610DRAFT_06963 [Streptomyces sp. LaPpAH-199]
MASTLVPADRENLRAYGDGHYLALAMDLLALDEDAAV